jgi:hypothetical protein
MIIEYSGTNSDGERTTPAVMGETVASTQRAESGVGPYGVRPPATAADEPAVASDIRKLPVRLQIVKPGTILW